MAPGSWPPWPGSIATTRVRMPGCMRMREASLGMTGRGAGCPAAATCGAGETAEATTAAACVVVAGALPGTAGADACPLRIAAGEGVMPAATTDAVGAAAAGMEEGAAAACWTTAAVNAAVARAASCRASALLACAGLAGTDAGAGCAVATCASPGHSISRRDSAPCPCSCGLNATTDSARSNTTRKVPGAGMPVRTAVTTPAAAGNLSPRTAVESGKSTTSRLGPASDRVL